MKNNTENEAVLSLDDIFSGIFSDENAGDDAVDEGKAHAKVCRGKQRHFERRIKSELVLEQELPWHFEEGATYHCMTHGDVDALTFLRTIVKQQKLRYLSISSWCMGMTDAVELHKWIEGGYIKRIDFYLDRIFFSSYAPIGEYLRKNCVVNGGRLAIVRNHSKVMAGFGEKFDFAIAGSSNLNSNPRIENVTITVSSEVSRFYKEFFDGINQWNRGDYPDWMPFDIDAPDDRGANA